MMLRLLLCAAVVAAAGLMYARERVWKDAVIVESGSERRSEIAGATTTGRVDTAGNVDADTRTRQRAWDENTYLIDAGDRVYVVSESIPRMGGRLISVPIKRGAHLVPGSQIKYAVDRDQLFVAGDDGKEHKFHIVRVSMKTPPKLQ